MSFICFFLCSYANEIEDDIRDIREDNLGKYFEEEKK
jgi:hypothetical protein